MKKLLSVLLTVFTLFVWAGTPKNDLEAAKKQAKTENKLILLKFSGSDWCMPCIKFEKNVISTPEFKAYAEQKLVLMEADFPIKKQNKLSAADQKKNDALADTFNKEGVFPKVVLLSPEGDVVKEWAYFDFTAEQFLAELQKVIK